MDARLRLLAWWVPRLLACTALRATAAAQARTEGVNVRAVSVQVVDAGDRPLAAAEITLRGERGRSFALRTDSTGTGEFRGVPEGLWIVSVRRLGQRAVMVSVPITAGPNRFTVQLEGDAVALDAVSVIAAKAGAGRIGDFERRRLAGIPSASVTRDQIERTAPIKLSRMLRGMPGLQLGDSLGNIVAVSTRGAKPSLVKGGVGFGLVQCVMRMSVDGVLLPSLSNIDQIIPGDVHGIEVYYGPARMPPELAGLRTDNWCGLIAVWTRDR